MYQLKMIYNCNTIVYMEFLPSYTSFINVMNNIKNSIPGRDLNFAFTKNTNMVELIRQKLLVPLDNAYSPQKPGTLNEFAIKGY